MSETTLNPALLALATAEAEAVATLHELNAHYIRAFVESDTAWYEQNLTDDFVCIRADGRRIDKAEFLRLTAEGPGVSNVSVDDVDVHLLGDVALVHGVTSYTRDGSPMSRRYTDVWRLRDDRWLAVAAQITPIVGG
jgi:ketosteroid isomerase-like protein